MKQSDYSRFIALAGACALACSGGDFSASRAGLDQDGAPDTVPDSGHTPQSDSGTHTGGFAGSGATGASSGGSGGSEVTLTGGSAGTHAGGFPNGGGSASAGGVGGSPAAGGTPAGGATSAGGSSGAAAGGVAATGGQTGSGGACYGSACPGPCDGSQCPQCWVTGTTDTYACPSKCPSGSGWCCLTDALSLNYVGCGCVYVTATGVGCR